MVKRIIHKSLGLVEPLAASVAQLLRIAASVHLHIDPVFADDGVIAGRCDEVMRTLQHMQAVMPLVGLRFSFLQVVAGSPGLQPAERFVHFTDLGCTPALGGNFQVRGHLLLVFCHETRRPADLSLFECGGVSMGAA